MLCAIWYHLYNLKNVKNIHGGMLLRAAACNFTEYNTPTFLKMYKQYQIPQNITYTF